MTEIGAFEAKNKLSALLERVARGDEIVITRRGRPIAKLVPIQEGRDSAKTKSAVEGLRAIAATLDLGPFDWASWKELRDAGRR